MGQRRKPLFRQTQLSFKKTDPNQSSPLPSQTPLKPLPRPTAPLVFRKSTPKKKRRIDSCAFDDECWEMGQRLIDGEPLNPKEKIVEEGASVVNLDDSNSDDDFEPPSVFSEVARQRPQLLTPTRMRNDRSSMTKSSANRGKKTKKPIRYTTPSQKRDSAQAANAKQRSIPALESSSSEDEVDHVVFEGEKSELSDTDDDEPVRASLRKGSKHGTSSRHFSPVVLHRREQHEDRRTVHERTNVLRAPKSPAIKKTATSNRISSNSQQRINNFGKSERDALLQVSEKCSGSKQAPKRACDLPQLFSDDSDDSIDIRIRRSSQRKRPRRKRRIQESSEEDSQQESEQVAVKQDTPRPGVEVEYSRNVPEIEVLLASASENDNRHHQDYELRILDAEGGMERKDSKRNHLDRDKSLKGHTSGHFPEEPGRSGKNSARSPLRSQTRRRLSFAGSQDTGITPPSSPSPPSTRKRRLRSKLFTIPSDEEDESQRGPPKCSEIPDRAQKPVECDRIPDETEWYHEREIDTFSSSGEDKNEPIQNSSPRKNVAVRSKKRVSAAKPGTQADLLTKLSPSPKEPVFDVSQDFVDDVNFKKHDVDRANVPHRTAHVRPPSNEVIDLVDDDDFEDIARRSTQKDNGLSSIEDVDGNDVEKLNELPSYDIDDSKPPPFNLYILCNDGESIVDMRDRLGENELMDKVMQARNAGREIIGGDKLGLAATFNKDIFSRFSKTVVGDQVSRQKRSASITEKALRGEYNFNYRGRERDQMRRGNQSRKRGSTRTGRGKSYRSRLSNLGHRRR